MKKPLYLAVISIAALGLTACTNASKDGATAADTKSSSNAVAVDKTAASLVPQSIKAKGMLTVAMDASYAPFEYFDTDNKTIIGFDADLSTAAAQKLGLKVKHVNAGFDTILPGLTSGKYDMGESAFSVTPERAKSVDFVAYLSSGSGIAVKPGNPEGLKMDPASLCGHKIAAQKGSTQGIQQLPDISKQCVANGSKAVVIQLYPSQNEANLAVTSGRADAVMADSVSLSYQGKLAGGKFELAPGDDYAPADIGIALPKGSALKPALEAAVKSVVADGTFAKLLKKWAIPSSSVPKGLS